MKPISASQRHNIISLSSHGLSSRKIASQTGLGKSTVCQVLQELQPEKTRLHGGRPSKLTPTNKRAIVQKIITGKARNAVHATHYINSIIDAPVCAQTVRNTLKEASLKAVVKKKKPLLSSGHKKKRLAFAFKYQHWTVEDWKRVIWSDETKINRIGSDGQEYVWKKKGEGLIAREVQGTVKFGGGSLMVWGCIGWNGVGVLSEVEGRMDAEQYVAILEAGLLQSMEDSGIPENEVIFQQDNDPKHTSRRAQIWFEEQEIKLLDWPAQSPDLNPIEHTWNHLKRCLSAYERAPTGVHQLWERVVEEWGKIDEEQCQKWIESMPRRITAVIKAKGAHTKY
jgi:transposase